MSHMALFLVVGVVLLSTVTVSTQSDVVTVLVGKEVTLNCSTSETITNIKKVLVEWKRAGSDILVFRNNRSDFVCTGFEGRVELAHLDLKDGNLSMHLKNATLNDKGKYECYFKGESTRKKRAAGPVVMSTIDLRVVDKPVSGGQMGEGPVGEDEGSQNPSNPGLVVGLVGGAVGVGVIVVAVAFLHHFKKSENHQKEKENSHNVKNKPEQDPLSDTTPPV